MDDINHKKDIIAKSNVAGVDARRIAGARVDTIGSSAAGVNARKCNTTRVNVTETDIGMGSINHIRKDVFKNNSPKKNCVEEIFLKNAILEEMILK